MANSGLQYEENLHYKYDQLLFQGKTPYEFHVDETATAGTKEQFFAGFSIKDMTVTSKIFFDLMKGPEVLMPEVGYIVVFGDKGKRTHDGTTRNNLKDPYPLILYDVTDKLNALGISAHDRSLHFSVSRYEDAFGNKLPLEDTFKPLAIFKNKTNKKTEMRVHTTYAGQYCPKIVHCNLDSSVAFLLDDGALCKDIKLVNDDGTSLSIKDDFKIRKRTNIFDIPTRRTKRGVTKLKIG